MGQLTQRPPVRTGKCSLILVIDGRRYRVTPGEPTRRGAKIWRLRVCPGQTRAGQLYSVCSVHGHIDCTCPDSTVNFAVCKHARALQALGLVAKSATPSIMMAWRNTQPSRRRKPPVPTLGQSAAADAAEVKAPIMQRTRRLHTPALAPTQADPADGFAVGWRNAVICHVEKRRAEGGVS
jgi:hypothetical protein